MKIKCGTGGEEKRAKEGLSKLVKVALFVNERCDTLGRSQMTKYASSDILDLIQYSIRSKACQGKLMSLSKEEVGNEFKKSCDVLHAFPPRGTKKPRKGRGGENPSSLRLKS